MRRRRFAGHDRNRPSGRGFWLGIGRGVSSRDRERDSRVCATRRGGGERARLRSGGAELRRANAPAKRRDRKREGVGEVPLTTAKLRSNDVVEETERNGGTTASSELDEGGGFGS